MTVVQKNFFTSNPTRLWDHIQEGHGDICPDQMGMWGITGDRQMVRNRKEARITGGMRTRADHCSLDALSPKPQVVIFIHHH